MSGSFLVWRDYHQAVASLGLVSPGAATDGVAPIFSWKKLTPFLVIAVCKVITFLAVRHRLSAVLSKFSRIFLEFHSGVTPWRVSPGVVPPSNVTVSGTTAAFRSYHNTYRYPATDHVTRTLSSSYIWNKTEIKQICFRFVSDEIVLFQFYFSATYMWNKTLKQIESRRNFSLPYCRAHLSITNDYDRLISVTRKHKQLFFSHLT